MKKYLLIVSVIIALGLFFCQLTPVQEAQAADVTVIVNGENLSFDAPPQIVQDRVLVPMRAIFEKLGASILWDGDTQTVTANKDGTEISLTIGKETASVNYNLVPLDVPAMIVNDRTMVPLRFISESLGAGVDWDAANYQVIIGTGGSGGSTGLSGSIKLSGSTSVQPLAEKLAQAFMQSNPGVSITITGGGSGVGIKDAAEGKVNIGNVSRALKDSDPAGLVATTIARDAVVIVVNPGNPVNSLSEDQVKQIFTGEITNWKEVGGNDAPIILNSRTAPSGTFDFFQEEFLGKGVPAAATAKQHASNGLVRQAVAANENAIGFVSMGYLDSTLKAPVMDGVVPNMDNAKNGTYQYVRPFVMATNGAPDALSQEFLNFILSPAGQAIVAQEYISIQ
jgi:phosphate transport system substrate-binding protein